MANELRVTCNRNQSKMVGTYEVDGGWLILHSPLGQHRVRLGIADPRKLATQLMRNVCTRASADTLSISQPSRAVADTYALATVAGLNQIAGRLLDPSPGIADSTSA